MVSAGCFGRILIREFLDRIEGGKLTCLEKAG